MRKILLLTLIFLNFSVLPSDAVEKKVVIDRLTQAEAEDLDIEIPDDVPPAETGGAGRARTDDDRIMSPGL